MSDIKRGEEFYNDFIGGDQNALEDLIRIYKESLTLFLYNYVNDWDEAEDLMIDTFARLVMNGNFKGKSSLKTYLFSIGKNLALKHLKKRNRHNALKYDKSIQDDSIEMSFEVEILDREKNKELYSAIQELSSDYRAAIYLLYFEDMSYEEAGRILGKTKKQINNLAYRGRLSLKDKLKQGGFRYEE